MFDRGKNESREISLEVVGLLMMQMVTWNRVTEKRFDNNLVCIHFQIFS